MRKVVLQYIVSIFSEVVHIALKLIITAVRVMSFANQHWHALDKQPFFMNYAANMCLLPCKISIFLICFYGLMIGVISDSCMLFLNYTFLVYSENLHSEY